MSALPIDTTSPAIAQVLAKVKDIAVLPQVVYRIIELTDGCDSSAKSMESAIVVDPGFSAKLLTKANSAYYGLPRKVTSIKDAIMFLGFKEVRQMAMQVGAFDLFVGKTDAESLRRRAWWRHSVDSAVCCKTIAEHARRGVAEEAYTSGLLHYIGKTILDRFAPERYAAIQMVVESGTSEVEAETQVYGCNHIDVGVAVGEHWGLPEVLVGGLAYAWEPEPNDPFADQIGIVALGDAIAKVVRQGLTVSDQEALGEVLPMWAVIRLQISLEKLVPLIDLCTAAISRAASTGM